MTLFEEIMDLIGPPVQVEPVKVSRQDPRNSQFVTNYMDDAVFDLSSVLENAAQALQGVEFDTIVGTGFSGGVVIPALALSLDKQFVLIRKESDDSHHGSGRLLGSLGKRCIFVDDFVSSGHTRDRVLHKISKACVDRGITTEYVGEYLYAHGGLDLQASPVSMPYPFKENESCS